MRGELGGVGILPDNVLCHPLKLKFMETGGTFSQMVIQLTTKFLPDLPIYGSGE
jgi:hypothetical protein